MLRIFTEHYLPVSDGMNTGFVALDFGHLTHVTDIDIFNPFSPCLRLKLRLIREEELLR